MRLDNASTPGISIGAFDTDVLLLVLLAFGLGLVGGGARLLRGFTEDRSKAMQVLGSLGCGAVAAVASFYVLDPTTPLKLIAACLIAGYAGPALLDALEARVKLSVAEARAARAAKIGEQAIRLADEALAIAAQAPEARMKHLVPALADPAIAELRRTSAQLRGELDAVAPRPAEDPRVDAEVHR